MKRKNDKENIIATFDSASAGYDNKALRFFPESAKHLASYLELRGDELVLDVATGTGNAAFALARDLPTGHITGIDASEGMLAQAVAKRDRNGIGNVEFRHMDMETIDFADDYFDLAVCAFGIFFVKDMQDQLRKISQKVKKGGRVITTSFHEASFLPQVDIFLGRIQAYEVETSPPAWRAIGTEAKCEAFFRTAGLADVKSHKQDLSYYLKDTGEWWDFVWNAGYRGLLNQLSAARLEEFKGEHLRDIQELISEQGIKVEVHVLYTVGTRA